MIPLFPAEETEERVCVTPGRRREEEEEKKRRERRSCGRGGGSCSWKTRRGREGQEEEK